MSVGEVAAWLPLVALAASMPVFERVRGDRSVDSDVARRPRSVLLGAWVREWFVWVISPLEKVLVERRVTPDALNFIGLGFGILAGAAFAAGVLPLAAWLLASSGTCDILDGRLARARRLSSARGAFLDSTLDRFAEMFVFVGLGWHVAGTPWMVVATLFAIAGSLLVSYTRARGEALGVACTVGFAQRPERLVLLAVAALLDPALARWTGWPDDTILSAAVVLIAVSAVGTAVYRTAFIARELSRRSGRRHAEREP